MVLKIVKKSMLFIAFIGSFQGLYSNSVNNPKIIAMSYADVIAIRQELAMVKKISEMLWNEALREKLVLVGPLLKLLFDKKISVTKLIEDNPALKKYKNKIYKLVALEQYLTDTLDILKELKKQGVCLVLAADSAADVIEYKQSIKPEIFDLFDTAYHENEDNGNKSTTEFYQGLRTAINEYASVTHATEILFVDSDKRNTDCALNADVNIASHLFIGVAGFKDELIKKGYLIEPFIV